MNTKNLLLGVFVLLTIVLASTTLIEHGQVSTVTTTTTVTVGVEMVTTTRTATVATTCSPAADQENPLMTFRVNVIYDGSWNATAIGYTNSTANQAFTKCYAGNGTGWILISDWNPSGGSILNVTIHKMDANSNNLTVTLDGQTRSTIAPHGSVTISATAVP